MPIKKESPDSGADLLAGVVAIGSLVANLLQAADRDHLTQERDTLRARLRQATGMIQTLQEQVRIRTAHYQTLRAAYVALKQETTELNQIVDASAKEADRLQKALTAANARILVLEAEKPSSALKGGRRRRPEVAS